MTETSREKRPVPRSSAGKTNGAERKNKKKPARRKSAWGMTLLGILLALVLVSSVLCFMAYRMLTAGEIQEYRPPVTVDSAREAATLTPYGAENDNTPVFQPGKNLEETVVVENLNPEEDGIPLQPLPEDSADKPIDPTGRVSPPENVLDNLF